MTYEQFEKLLLNYRQFADNVYEISEIGFNLHEGKYPIVDHVETILSTCIESHYGEEGVQWVEWLFLNLIGEIEIGHYMIHIMKKVRLLTRKER